MSLSTFLDFTRLELFSISDGSGGETYVSMVGDVFEFLMMKLGEFNYHNPVKNSLRTHSLTESVGHLVNGSKMNLDTAMLRSVDAFFDGFFSVRNTFPSP